MHLALFLLIIFISAPVFAQEMPGMPAKPAGVKGSDDVCLNEQISIVNGKVTTDTKTPQDQYRACKGYVGDTLVNPVCNWERDTNNPKATGVPRCTCGVAIFSLPTILADATPQKALNPISKCDPEGAQKRNAANTGGLSRQSTSLLAQAVEKQQFQTIGSQPLTQEQQAIFSAFGIQDEQATQLAKKDPVATKDLLTGLSTGNLAQAEGAAQKLGLSSAEFSTLRQNVALLTPEAAIDGARFTNEAGARQLARELCLTSGRCTTTTFGDVRSRGTPPAPQNGTNDPFVQWRTQAPQSPFAYSGYGGAQAGIGGSGMGGAGSLGGLQGILQRLLSSGQQSSGSSQSNVQNYGPFSLIPSSTRDEALMSALETARGPAALTLLAQPKTAAPGAPVRISWASVNVSVQVPCHIFYESAGKQTTIARSNNGSTRVRFSQLSGDVAIRAQCQNLSGETLEKAVVVTVQ